MKKKFLYFVFLFYLVSFNSNLNAQLSWFFQNSGTSADLMSIRFLNSNTAWAVGWFANILKTTNGGVNWNQVNPGVTTSFQDAYFVDVNTGWVVGLNGTIIKTTNSGNNWFQQTSGLSELLMSVHFYNLQTGWVVGYNGKVLKTTNGGNSWVLKNANSSSNLLSVYFYNINLGFISGDAGLLRKSTNAGETWITIQTPVVYNLGKLFFINDNTGWITGVNGTILKTTNSGNNWLYTYTGVYTWISAVHFFDIYTGYACGGDYSDPVGGYILKTINGGINWFLTSHPTIPWMSYIKFLSPDTGWCVGRNGTIIKTIDGGVSIPLPPTLYSPSNNSTVYTLTPYLSWYVSGAASFYTVQVSPTNTFSVITDSATIINPNYYIPGGKLINGNSYFWRVKAGNNLGISGWSDIWKFTVSATNINTISSSVPNDFRLYQNYPNPFNPATKIKFDLPKNEYVNIIIYNSLGQVVENLYKGSLSGGTYSLNWNASKYNSGIYFVRFNSKEFADTKKLLLVK